MFLPPARRDPGTSHPTSQPGQGPRADPGGQPPRGHQRGRRPPTKSQGPLLQTEERSRQKCEMALAHSSTPSPRSTAAVQLQMQPPPPRRGLSADPQQRMVAPLPPACRDSGVRRGHSLERARQPSPVGAAGSRTFLAAQVDCATQRRSPSAERPRAGAPAKGGQQTAGLAAQLQLRPTPLRGLSANRLRAAAPHQRAAGRELPRQPVGQPALSGAEAPSRGTASHGLHASQSNGVVPNGRSHFGSSSAVPVSPLLMHESSIASPSTVTHVPSVGSPSPPRADWGPQHRGPSCSVAAGEDKPDAEGLPAPHSWGFGRAASSPRVASQQAAQGLGTPPQPVPELSLGESPAEAALDGMTFNMSPLALASARSQHTQGPTFELDLDKLMTLSSSSSGTLTLIPSALGLFSGRSHEPATGQQEKEKKQKTTSCCTHREVQRPSEPVSKAEPAAEPPRSRHFAGRSLQQEPPRAPAASREIAEAAATTGAAAPARAAREEEDVVVQEEGTNSEPVSTVARMRSLWESRARSPPSGVASGSACVGRKAAPMPSQQLRRVSAPPSSSHDELQVQPGAASQGAPAAQHQANAPAASPPIPAASQQPTEAKTKPAQVPCFMWKASRAAVPCKPERPAEQKPQQAPEQLLEQSPDPPPLPAEHALLQETHDALSATCNPERLSRQASAQLLEQSPDQPPLPAERQLLQDPSLCTVELECEDTFLVSRQKVEISTSWSTSTLPLEEQTELDQTLKASTFLRVDHLKGEEPELEQTLKGISACTTAAATDGPTGSSVATEPFGTSVVDLRLRDVAEEGDAAEVEDTSMGLPSSSSQGPSDVEDEGSEGSSGCLESGSNTGCESEEEDSFCADGVPKPGEEGMPRSNTFLHHLEQCELQRQVMVVVPEGMTENRMVSFVFENRKHDVQIPEGFQIGQEVPILVPKRPPLERTPAQAQCRGHGHFLDRYGILEILKHGSRLSRTCTLQDPEFKHRHHLYSLLRGTSMAPLLPFLPEETPGSGRECQRPSGESDT